MTMVQDIRPSRTSPVSWADDAGEQLAMRQLRHHTKNGLQRVLCQVATCPGLLRDPAGRALAAELERRIVLSSTVSDALFGLTHAPQPLQTRLQALAAAHVELMSDGDQVITTTVTVTGACPAAYEDTLLRVSHELVGNAVKHGMTLRLIGRIEIAVDATARGVTMSVTDDGWGPCDGSFLGHGGRGEGLRIAELLAEQHGGALSLHRDRSRTVALLTLPPAGSDAAGARHPS